MKEFFTSRFETIKQFFSTQAVPTSDWKNIFSWDFWTESFVNNTSVYTAFSGMAIIVIVTALIIWRKRIKKAHQQVPIYEPVLNHIANIIAFIIIISLSYYFFRSQSIAYLSSRLVILTSLIVIILWLGWVIYLQTRVNPPKRREYLEKERFFRYLPKKKEISEKRTKKK